MDTRVFNLAMKVAIFDLGSNTTKLLVAEIAERGRPQVVAEESRLQVNHGWRQ